MISTRSSDGLVGAASAGVVAARHGCCSVAARGRAGGSRSSSRLATRRAPVRAAGPEAGRRDLMRTGARSGACCSTANRLRRGLSSTATGQAPISPQSSASRRERGRALQARGLRILRAGTGCGHRLAHRSANTPRGSRRNIASHYDLGNDFYAPWLDAGHELFVRALPIGGETLEEAQTAKLDRVVDLLELNGARAVCWRSAAAGARSRAARPQRGAARHRADAVARAARAMPQPRWRPEARRQSASCDFRTIATSTAASTASSRSRCWKRSASAIGRSISTSCASCSRPAASRCCRSSRSARTASRLSEPARISSSATSSPAACCRPSASRASRPRRAGCAVAQHRESFGDSYAHTLAEWRRRFLAAWPQIAATGLRPALPADVGLLSRLLRSRLRSGAIDVSLFRFRV